MELSECALCQWGAGSRPSWSKPCWSPGGEVPLSSAEAGCCWDTDISPLPKARSPGRGWSFGGWGQYGQRTYGRHGGMAFLPMRRTVFAHRCRNGQMQTRAAFPEDQARNFSCHMYKTVFRGIFRLFNYSFASGTQCLCFPIMPAASLKLI